MRREVTTAGTPSGWSSRSVWPGGATTDARCWSSRTAGGDAEEIERNGVVGACWPLIESGRVKLYSCDSVPGQAMVAKAGSPEYRMWLFNQYHHAVRHEVVPAIRADMGGDETPIVGGRRLHRGVQLARRALPLPGRVPRRRWA